jgi:hypothetical protein
MAMVVNCVCYSGEKWEFFYFLIEKCKKVGESGWKCHNFITFVESVAVVFPVIHYVILY